MNKQIEKLLRPLMKNNQLWYSFDKQRKQWIMSIPNDIALKLFEEIYNLNPEQFVEKD